MRGLGHAGEHLGEDVHPIDFRCSHAVAFNIVLVCYALLLGSKGVAVSVLARVVPCLTDAYAVLAMPDSTLVKKYIS